MKKICFLIIIAVASLSSCSKQLDLYSHSAMSPESVTENDLPALRLGMYNNMQNDPGVHAFIVFDLLGGDIHTASGAPIDLINSTLTPLGGIVSNGWNGYYGALYQVNNVISICETIDSNPSRDLTLGEAHYFRALLYYDLVTRWGGVPILKENTLEKTARNSEEEVWQFIEDELMLSEQLLGASKSYYYVSLDAVEALLARVLLYRGKKQGAFERAERLITSGKYKLDAFEKIFRKQGNSEVIFAFENLSEESRINISDLFYSYAHPNKGQGNYRLTQQIINAYAAEDKRSEITYINIAGTYCVNKYPSGQTGKDPVIISRIAEMYLVRHNMAEGVLGVLPFQTKLPIPGRELQYNENLEPNPGY